MPEPSTHRKPAPAADPSTSRSLFFPNYSWPKEFLRHRVRLSRGVYQLALLDLVRQRSEGRKRGKGEPVPEWCWRFNIEETAAEWGCSARELREDLADAVKRGLIESRKQGHDVECRLTCADSQAKDGLSLEAWDKLPSYKRPGPQLVASAPEPKGSEDEAEPPQKKAAGRQVLKPLKLREGAAPRPQPIEVGVSKWRAKWTGPGEVHFEGQIVAGEMEVSAYLTPSGLKELRETSGSVVPIDHLPVPQEDMLPEEIIRAGSLDELATDIARLGPELSEKDAGSILKGIMRVRGSVDEVKAYYLKLLEEKRDYFARKGGKLTIGGCFKALQELPEKWKVRQKAGPVPKPADDLETLYGPEGAKKFRRTAELARRLS